MEENNQWGLFSIFLIIDFSLSKTDLDNILKNLKNIEEETDLKVIVSTSYEEQEAFFPESENHVITILGTDRLGIIAKISSFFHDYNINIEKTKTIASGQFFSMEMIINTSKIDINNLSSYQEALESMKKELIVLCSELNQSVVIQSEKMYGKMKKLIVFDVESTLIQESTLSEFLRSVSTKIREIREINILKDGENLNMQILIDNIESLKGISMDQFVRLIKILRLNQGTFELINILKSMGFKIALLSSGFNSLIKRIFEEVEIDYAFSNSLKIDENGLITGELEEPIITDLTKNTILDLIMNLENLDREQVIAIGDGSIKADFMKNVGLSIAYKPDKRNVKTNGILDSNFILHVLYCLGIPKTELDNYLKK